MASDASAPALSFASDIQDIASLSSASELLAMAQRWREQEGKTRTPFILLQLLALTRQFVCLNLEPEDKRKKATWYKALKKHVWDFYGKEERHEWRKLLAWRLQEVAHDAPLHSSLLSAMANVHASTVKEMLSKLWIPGCATMLLVALEQVSERNLVYSAVRSILAHVTSEVKDAIKEKPPVNRNDALAHVQAWIEADAAETAARAAASAAAAARPAPRFSASAAIAAMSDTGAESGPASHKRKRSTADAAEEKKIKKHMGMQNQDDDNEEMSSTHPDRDAELDQPGAEPMDILDSDLYAGADEPCKSAEGHASHQSSPIHISDEEPGADAIQSDSRSHAEVVMEHADSGFVPPSHLIVESADAPTILPESRAEGATEESSQPAGTVEVEDEELCAALKESKAEFDRTPRATAKQRQDYDQIVNAHLAATNSVLRIVPGRGNCLFASVVLGCQSAGIDLCRELGLKNADESSLRVFIADWIRSHKQVLYGVAGANDTWRGAPVRVAGKRSSRAPKMAPATLDQCLDLLADVNERRYDIPWSSVERGDAKTSLGDYIPTMLAIALNIRIIMIRPHSEPMKAGDYRPNADGEWKLVDVGREITIVQSIAQNHWDAALPREPKLDSTRQSLAAPEPAPSASASSLTENRPVSSPPSLNIRLDPQLTPVTTGELTQEEGKQLSGQEVMEAMNTINDLVRCLQMSPPDYVRRISQGLTDSDSVGTILREILELQTSLPALDFNKQLPLFAVTENMCECWEHDVEQLESSLGAPYRTHEEVNDFNAREVCNRVDGWRIEASDRPWMEMLLLTKRIGCVQELLPTLDPKEENSTSPALLELHAAVLRLVIAPRVWSYGIWLPSQLFLDKRGRLGRRSANLYLKAAESEELDITQQLRLHVQHCQVLDECGLLRHAKVPSPLEQFQYPDAPFQQLQKAYSEYPAAGEVSVSIETLNQWDVELRAWKKQLGDANTLLKNVKGRDEKQQAQNAADALREARPCIFEQKMNASRVSFHPDKRKTDFSTSADDQSRQFDEVSTAWTTLSNYRTYIEQLHEYHAKVQTLLK